ncbi:hypothetical protein [Parasediminibacterium sp. JCM 36343]|uniref:hypothetical protein n=1 Tax=Parasediminibacterium sp. JCM 36343 TaxID=3374279 RepID=UPI00397E21D2
MKLNWVLLIIFGVAAIALIVFLIKRNIKDEKKFEKQANNNYPIENNKKDSMGSDEMME